MKHELGGETKQRIDRQINQTGFFFIVIPCGGMSEIQHKQVEYALEKNANIVAIVEEGTETSKEFEDYPWKDVLYASKEKIQDQRWIQKKTGELIKEESGFVDKIKMMFEGMKRLPYKRYWFVLFGVTIIFFSWWDDVAVWGATAGLHWLPSWIPVFWIPGIYYGLEFGVLMPLTILLAKKTYEKMPVDISLKEIAFESLKNNAFVIAYRKIKRKLKS